MVGVKTLAGIGSVCSDVLPVADGDERGKTVGSVVVVLLLERSIDSGMRIWQRFVNVKTFGKLAVSWLRAENDHANVN